MADYCRCGAPWIKGDICERCNKEIEPSRLGALTTEEVLPTLATAEIIHAKGVGGSISFDGKMITLRHKGLLALGTVGMVPEKQIPIERVISIQFKSAGMINGYIQFATGAGEASGGIFDATKDENTIMFDYRSQKQMEVLKGEVEKAMRSLQNRTSNQGISTADELKKFMELYKEGIISEEEFAQQKRKLLGN